MAVTMHWAPKMSDASVIKEGFLTAEVFTVILSAPARMPRMSSMVLMPPPTVMGMKTSLAVPLDHVDHRRPALVGSGDVQEHQLVGALLVVGPRELHGDARPAQVHEFHALDHPAAVRADGDVEAGMTLL